MMQSIQQIATQRLQDGRFIEDLADLSGKEIRKELMNSLLQMEQSQFAATAQTLTEDEKFVLAQFM